jgi:hypothetical protein
LVDLKGVLLIPLKQVLVTGCLTLGLGLISIEGVLKLSIHLLDFSDELMLHTFKKLDIVILDLFSLTLKVKQNSKECEERNTFLKKERDKIVEHYHQLKRTMA